MFDIGGGELVVLAGLTLMLLGPKRMPGLVRKVGRWVGKARTMARDFQQQLENEVNLEELNKMTEQVTRDALGTMPPPPDPVAEPPPAETSAYPYSAQDPSSAEGATENPAADAPPAAEAAQADDTFSHAHAKGDAPMPDVAQHAAADAAQAAGSHSDIPVQADLDLTPPDDNSHLPPDDARRYS